MTKLPTLSASSFNSGLFQYVASSELNDNVMVFHKFGQNTDVDTAAQEDVWDLGGVYEYSATASKLTLSSTSAEDNPLGTGIGSVSIQGLDENWDLVSEVIELDGISPIETANSYIRAFRIKALTASDENNKAAGIVTLKDDTLTLAAISAGNTSTKMTMLSVPAGYSAFVSGVIIAGGPNDDFIVESKTRALGGSFASTNDFEISNSAVLFPEFDPAIGKIDEMSDIKFSAIGVNNNAQVRIQYACVMIKNDFLSALANRI